MSGHTPGPWVVLQNPMSHDCITSDDCRICDMPRWDDEYAEEETANARLIAAAPDLLEALQAIEKYMRADFDDMPMSGKARAAIAKATGEGA